MTNNYPAYKQEYKYNNIGLIVGNLNYAKESINQQGQRYGHEFLINARGQGSANVRIPKLNVSSDAIDNFPVSEKPKVRIGMTKIDQFVTNQGKRYTNFVSFVHIEEALNASGEAMQDSIKGRLGGEVFGIRQDGENILFNIVSYSTDKEGKLMTRQDGTPYDPDVVEVVIIDPAIAQEFRTQVNEGSNIEVGYKYINKNDVSFDEFGFPTGSGETIERVEVGKLMVHQRANPGQQINGFGQQQGNQQGQPGASFDQAFNQAQQGFQQPNQQQNGFGNMQPANNEIHQQAEQIFGQPGQQGNGFGFGN